MTRAIRKKTADVTPTKVNHSTAINRFFISPYPGYGGVNRFRSFLSGVYRIGSLTIFPGNFQEKSIVVRADAASPRAFTKPYDKYAAFFVIARALIVAFFQSRPRLFSRLSLLFAGCSHVIPGLEAENYISPFPPLKKPSDHFGGSGDYPLATVSGRCQLLRLDKPHPENSLRSDIQGAWLIFASSWHAPSQLLLEGNRPTLQNASIYSL